jgi:hypothetical protein
LSGTPKIGVPNAAEKMTYMNSSDESSAPASILQTNSGTEFAEGEMLMRLILTLPFPYRENWMN